MNRLIRSGMRWQRGFSLVELMVAMTLSLLLLAGALSILYSSKITYNENDRLARLQEAGRTVLELVLRDARAAGFLGCSRPLNAGDFANGLSDATSLLSNFELPVFGNEATGSSTWAPATDPAVVSPASGSDILVLRTTRQGQPVFRTTSVVTPTAAIPVAGDSGSAVAADTPMIISDCRGSSVFMATGYTATDATSGEISHGIGSAGVGNATAELTRAFDIDAQVMPVQTVIYYVRDGGNGPSLWQRVGTSAPQELVPGVQNLQVRYGIDTNGNLLVDEYQTASGVEAANNWNRVVSLELAVLVRSPDETGTDRDNRVYDLLDTPFGPFNDRRQRTVFTTTVVLRNRAF
jgi:type IV pilus assembly protein PilW